MNAISRIIVVAVAIITLHSSAFAVPTATGTPTSKMPVGKAGQINVKLAQQRILARVDALDAKSMQVTQLVGGQLAPGKMMTLTVDANTKFSSKISKGDLVEVTYNAAGYALFVSYAKP